MKIGFLTFITPHKTLRDYRGAIRFFKKAALERGHSLKIIQTNLCEFTMSGKGLNIYYKSKPFPKVDCILPRLSIGQDIESELLINRHLLAMGYTLLNDAQPFAIAKNKIVTFQVLVKAGLPVPNTVVVRSLEDIDHALKLLHSFPIIVKVPVGSLGKGVAIVETRRSLLSTIGMVMSQGIRNIILQEYIEEANGTDLRVFVIGDKVVASMQRSAAEGDFRSNIYQGGQGSKIEITNQEKLVAVRAAKALGLDVAGVDILRSKKGPLIMEVNSNPGLSGITAISGIDVAGAIIDFLVKKTLRNKKAAKK